MNRAEIFQKKYFAPVGKFSEFLEKHQIPKNF